MPRRRTPSRDGVVAGRSPDQSPKAGFCCLLLRPLAELDQHAGRRLRMQEGDAVAARALAEPEMEDPSSSAWSRVRSECACDSFAADVDDVAVVEHMGHSAATASIEASAARR